MKKIFITGAGPNSASGKRLKEYLQAYYSVLSPETAKLDLTDTDSVKQFILKEKPDIIIHCATHNPKKNPQIEQCETNLRMFYNLTSMQEYYEKLIYLGTGAEFGKHQSIIEAKEEYFGENVPKDTYGFSKFMQTIFAMNNNNHNIINLRLFGMMNVYEDYSRNFISNICTKAALDIPLTIRRDCRFSFLDIDDLAKMIQWTIENNTNFTDYNACNNQYYYLTELAQTVLRISGKKLRVHILAEGMNYEYTGNGSRILDESQVECCPVPQTLEKVYSYFYDQRASFSRRHVMSSR